MCKKRKKKKKKRENETQNSRIIPIQTLTVFVNFDIKLIFFIYKINNPGNTQNINRMKM